MIDNPSICPRVWAACKRLPNIVNSSSFQIVKEGQLVAVGFMLGNEGYMKIYGSECFVRAINGVLLDDALTIVNIAIPKLLMDGRSVASLLLNLFTV